MDFNQKGFTLIEVMIAVSIITVMSLTSYSVINGSLNAKSRLETREERLHGVRVGLNKMAEDIIQAFVADPSFAGTENYFKSFFEGKKDSLKFSNFGHYHFVEGAKDSDQVVVNYFLKKSDDRDAGYSLRRSESNTLVPDTEKDARDYEVIPYVKDMTFTFYDASKEDWVASWNTEQVASLGKLPRAVKIQIVVTDPNSEKNQEFKYETIALIDNFNTAISF